MLLFGHLTRELSKIAGLSGEGDPDIGLLDPVWIDRSSHFCPCFFIGDVVIREPVVRAVDV